MPTLDLSSYEPAPNTDLDANQITNGMSAIQTTVNGLDSSNWASGKIFHPNKIEQDGATTGQALAWNGTDYVPADLAPKQVDVDCYMTAISQTNWDTITIDSSSVYCATKNNSGSLNDEINFDVVLAAGTWTVEVMYAKESAAGIATLQLSSDGGTSFTNIGSAPYSGSASTIDAYAAATARNTRTAITGLTIAGGAYRLKLKMTSKNASASAYNFPLQHIQFRRTA